MTIRKKTRQAKGELDWSEVQWKQGLSLMQYEHVKSVGKNVVYYACIRKILVITVYATVCTPRGRPINKLVAWNTSSQNDTSTTFRTECSLWTTLLPKNACHTKIQDGDHFFKMADTSGKEITTFAKNVPSCPSGMILLSNHIVSSM